MLNFLKGSECPICKCNIVIEETIEHEKFSKFGKLEYREHSSGGRWETRKFACGCKLEYIPNYSKTMISEYSACTNNEDYINDKRKRQDFKKVLREFISNYKDVDEKYKEKMLDTLTYI